MNTTPNPASLAVMEPGSLAEVIITYLKYYFAKTDIEENIRTQVGLLDENEAQLLKRLDKDFEEFSDKIFNKNYYEWKANSNAEGAIDVFKKFTRIYLCVAAVFAFFFLYILIDDGLAFALISTPSMLLMSALFGGALWLATRILIKIAGGTDGWLSNFIWNIQRKNAIRKDRNYCHKHNITAASLKEAYKYAEQKANTVSTFEGLRQEVYEYYQDELAEMTKMEAYLARWFPEDYTNADHLVFIVKQLNNHAADTWKEALVLLQHELQHQQQMELMGHIAQGVEENRREIKKQAKQLQRSIGNLHDEMDRRISGLAEAINSYHRQQMDAIYDTAYWY